MTRPAGPSAAMVMYALGLRGLRVSDPELNRLAADFLVGLGPPAVPDLVRAAWARGNPPGYRARALAVLGRIGALTPADALDLLPLLRDRHPLVRQAAWDVLHPAPAATG